MKIKRELKYYDFEIDEETKEVTIWDKRNEHGIDKVVLNKTYMFSFIRFAIRYFYRLSIKRRK